MCCISFFAHCSWKSFLEKFWAAFRPVLLCRSTVNSWVCFLLCFVCFFLTKTSSFAPLSPSSGTRHLPTRSASLILMRSGKKIQEMMNSVLIFGRNNAKLMSCSCIIVCTKYIQWLLPNRLMTFPFFNAQANSKPCEAKDPDYPSQLRSCQCVRRAQWTVFSELGIKHCLLLSVLCIYGLSCLLRVKVPNWRPGSAGFHFHQQGRETHCWETLLS